MYTELGQSSLLLVCTICVDDDGWNGWKLARNFVQSWNKFLYTQTNEKKTKYISFYKHITLSQHIVHVQIDKKHKNNRINERCDKAMQAVHIHTHQTFMVVWTLKKEKSNHNSNNNTNNPFDPEFHTINLQGLLF